MRGVLRQGCALLIVLAFASAPRAFAEVHATLSAYTDQYGVTLERSTTNAVGVSEWSMICALPCERLHLDPWLSYRTAGELMLPSEPFQLLPTGDPQILLVRAKTQSDLNTNRGLLIGGLAGVAIGASLLVPGVLLMAHGCATETFAPCTLVDGIVLAGVGILTVLAGGIIAIVSGVSLANDNTTVTLSVDSPAATR